MMSGTSEEQEQIMALRAQVNKLKQSKANEGDNPNNRSGDKSTSESKSTGQPRRDQRISGIDQRGCPFLQRKMKDMRRQSMKRSIIGVQSMRHGDVTYLRNAQARATILASARSGLQMMSKATNNLKRNLRVQRVRSSRLPRPLLAFSMKTLNDLHAHGVTYDMGLRSYSLTFRLHS